MLDMDSVFEFELMARWVPQEPEAACSVVKDGSTVTATNSSLTPTVTDGCKSIWRHLHDSDGFKSIWRHLHVQLSRAQQVSLSLLPRVELTLKLCTTSDCCRVLCRIVSPAQTVPSGGKSPQTSEDEKTSLEIQDCLQMPVIQTSAVIGKNTDGSDITQDVDVLVWVEGRRTSSFSSHRCHDSSIPGYSCV